MRPLKDMLTTAPTVLAAGSTDRVAARAASVRAMFKDAITHSYKEAAPAVLAHVNAVYILKEEKDGHTHKTLQVYMDDANFRSDVHARQYFIILWLQERYGEVIDEFVTYSARAAMRQRKAYEADDLHPHDGLREEDVIIRPITEQDEQSMARWGSTIEDLRVRNAFLKAARSGLARWS